MPQWFPLTQPVLLVVLGLLTLAAALYPDYRLNVGDKRTFWQTQHHELLWQPCRLEQDVVSPSAQRTPKSFSLSLLLSLPSLFLFFSLFFMIRWCLLLRQWFSSRRFSTQGRLRHATEISSVPAVTTTFSSLEVLTTFWICLLHKRVVSILPRKGRPFSCVEGVSELFDGVVLTGKAEDSLLFQSVLYDELRTLLYQDWYRVRSEALLVR